MRFALRRVGFFVLTLWAALSINFLLPRIMPGEAHALRAELRGDKLTVTADGRVAWEGTLAVEAATIDGPMGLRTDNARFAFDYYVEQRSSTEQSGPLDTTLNHCEKSPGD